MMLLLLLLSSAPGSRPFSISPRGSRGRQRASRLVITAWGRIAEDRKRAAAGAPELEGRGSYSVAKRAELSAAVLIEAEVTDEVEEAAIYMPMDAVVIAPADSNSTSSAGTHLSVSTSREPGDFFFGKPNLPMDAVTTAAKRAATGAELSAAVLIEVEATEEAEEATIYLPMDAAATASADSNSTSSVDTPSVSTSREPVDFFFDKPGLPMDLVITAPVDLNSTSYVGTPSSSPAAARARARPGPVSMRKLKKIEDEGGSPFASALLAIDPTGTVRRRLWTKADFLHVHALSGAYFLTLGPAWLVYSHVLGWMRPDEGMGTSGPFLVTILASGLVNVLSAVPMSRFSSDKLFDLEDLKANGFTLGGTGLTCMCLWVAWWFSGSYPDALRPLDGPLFLVWAAVCVASTANWEYMLQQNFEASEGRARRSKFGREDASEMRQKTLLYRLASWPNLTQLAFISSIPLGGEAWAAGIAERWPMQMAPMYHYSIASAMGYALSMFAETLRDRKLIDLQTDLAILGVGFLLPMVSVVVDKCTYGDAVTINPLDYWPLFTGAPGV